MKRHEVIEDLLPKANGSVYALVRLAANRAIELAEGKPRLIEKPSLDKETTIALEEISYGKVMSKESSSLFEKNKLNKN